MSKYLFVIGTGRTGTIYLSQYFKANVERCHAVHEPRRLIKLMSNAHLSGLVGQPAMRRFMHGHRRWVDRALARRGCDVYLQCDPWLYGFTGELEEAFDSPYVVHVVRHPLSHIPSHLNRWYREAWSGFLRDTIPFWRLRAYRTGDMSREEWRALAPEQQTAWYWAKINGLIESRRGGIRNFLRIRYEDLFSDEGAGVSRLFEFAGLDLRVTPERSSDFYRHAAPPKFPPAREWSPEVTRWVLETCGPLMREYGYDAHESLAADAG